MAADPVVLKGTIVNRKILIIAGMSLLAAQPAPSLAAALAAKDYPSKFIRIVVPYGAGAGPDVVGRIIAEKLGPALGTNIVFENRGGGGGMLGTEIVAKSAPDGYTLLF